MWAVCLTPSWLIRPVVVFNCSEIGGGGVSTLGAFTGSGTTFCRISIFSSTLGGGGGGVSSFSSISYFTCSSGRISIRLASTSVFSLAANCLIFITTKGVIAAIQKIRVPMIIDLVKILL